MTDWMAAVGKRRASARWAYPHDLSDVRDEGQVIGYSSSPMVLIQTDDGKQFWWGAELCRLIDEPAGEQRDTQAAVNRMFADLERIAAGMTPVRWGTRIDKAWFLALTMPLRWEGDDS